jgi:hypothetical protein
MKRMNSLNPLSQAYRSAILIALLLSFPSFATVVASVNKNSVAQNEVFMLRISSDQSVNADDLDLSSLNQDFIVGRPSFSNSVRIINGKHSSSSEWSVTIATTHTGIVTIPSLTVANEQTQPIAIQVINDTSAPATDSLVEMQSQLDRDELYPNESALLSVRLVIKADTRRLQNPQITPPSAQGIRLEPASESDQHQEVINGLNATVLQQTFRITATESGSFSLTEPKFSSTLLYNSGRGDTRIMSLETSPKTYSIHVLPKPDQYQGNWLPTSQLTLNQSWLNGEGKTINNSTGRYAMKVGDSLTRITTLTVKGMTQEHLPHLTISYPDSIRLYEEKPKFSTNSQGDTVMAIKQVLIPSQAGSFTLPNVDVNWWNTHSKQSQLARLSGLTLAVEKGTTVNSEFSLPEVPKAVAEPQTITKHDPGFWPYLAGFFALLWLITTALLFSERKRRRLPQETDHNTEKNNDSNLSTIDALTKACKVGDGISISQLTQQWLDETTLSTEQREQVKQQLDIVLNALYAKPNTIKTATADGIQRRKMAVESGPLLKLIRTLTKSSHKKKKGSQEALAKL